MRVRSLLAAAAAMVLTGSVASADIVITFTRQDGTGLNAGQDIIRFFGAFTPTSFLGTPDNAATPEREGWGATGLQSVSARMEALENGTFKFRFTDENGDGVMDADTDSSTVGTRTTTLSNGTLGTHIRVGPTGAGAWTPVLVEPPGDTSVTDPISGEPIGPQPEANYANLKLFRVEGANPNAPDLGARTANAGGAGQGALFAVAVVPDNSHVRVFGQIAANAGPIETFDVTTIPEPTALGFIGLGAAGLLGRRRRA